MDNFITMGFVLTVLTGCTQQANICQREIDMLDAGNSVYFETISTDKLCPASQKYGKKFQNVINKCLKPLDKYHGEYCNVTITLDRQARIEKVEAKTGNPRLCSAATQVLANCHFNEFPDETQYRIFKINTVNIHPE